MVRILIDMDEVMADFTKARTEDVLKRNPAQMYNRGFFADLEPVDGALEYVQKLYQTKGVELEVVTKPVASSPISYTEKVCWIARWFPYLLNKITLTQNKENIKGDILIDDTPCEGFRGHQIRFVVGSGREGWEEAYRKTTLLVHDILTDSDDDLVWRD